MDALESGHSDTGGLGGPERDASGSLMVVVDV